MTKVESILEQFNVPYVQPRKYWLVRTDSGSHYEDFTLTGLIPNNHRFSCSIGRHKLQIAWRGDAPVSHLLSPHSMHDGIRKYI